MADGDIDELELWLTSGDNIALLVLLGLSSLASDLTGDDDLATDGTTTSHDGGKNVVGGKTNGSTAEELELEVLSLSRSTEVLVVGKGLDGEFNLVVNIVEVVSLLDETLELTDLSATLLENLLSLGGLDSDFS